MHDISGKLMGHWPDNNAMSLNDEYGSLQFHSILVISYSMRA